MRMTWYDEKNIFYKSKQLKDTVAATDVRSAQVGPHIKIAQFPNLTRREIVS